VTDQPQFRVGQIEPMPCLEQMLYALAFDQCA
jgi:hypothetical protein